MKTWRGVALGLLLAGALAACSTADGSTKVRVVVDGRALTPDDMNRVRIVCLFVDGDTDGGQISQVFQISGLVNGQYSFDYQPKNLSGLLTITITVKALDGTPLATSMSTVEVRKGQKVPAIVTLGSGAPDGGLPDGASMVDASPECNAMACSGTVADSCCPGACNATTDVDCNGCGNGRLDPGETCDPLASCPTACPQVACEQFSVANAGTCQAACVSSGFQTACVNGDSCCPTGCNSGNDSDCQVRCGNGIVEGTELCDGDCPTQCDALGCQLRTLVGSATTCDAHCVNGATQTVCAAGDQCCPGACNSTSDADCALRCGNGIVESGELCDGNCPTTCPAMGCQLRQQQGSAATCDAQCVNGGMQTLCANNDGCCPPGCNANNDNNCTPSCGNGILEGAETCDPAGVCTTAQTGCVSNANSIATGSGSAAACTFVCSRVQRACGPADGFCPTNITCGPTTDVDCAGCGNGRIEVPLGEHCDPVSMCTTQQTACVSDANTIRTASGSAAACTFQCTTAARTCGPADGFCPTGCGPTMDVDCAGCGNGRIESGETCDVAPAATTCASLTCDDGMVCTKDTRAGSDAACNVTCSHTNITACMNGDGCCAPGCNATNDTDCGVVCGNGVREGGETCEVAPASPLCTSITCNDGNACTTDVRNGANGSCNVTCTNTAITACVSGDGCCPGGGLGACNHNNDTDCAVRCGNGVIETPETCDITPASPTCASLTCNDNNACTTDPRSGADASCNVVCGAHTAITACTGGDGCCPGGGTGACNHLNDTDCAPFCGNGVVESPETCDKTIPVGSAGACPTSCPQQACTLRTLANPGTCTAACMNVGPQTACVDNDNCCPTGCDDFSDSDCLPKNDLCADATDISAGGDFPFGTFQAKKELAVPACDSTGTTDLYFTFTLANPSAIYLDVFDPAGNTVNVGLELYGLACNFAKPTIGCDFGSGAKNCQSAKDWPRIVNTNLPAGTYTVLARTLNDKPGRYTLRFQRVPTACVAAGALGPLQQGNTCGTDQYSPFCAASGTDKTYYLVKCPATKVNVNTCSAKTPINTLLAVNESSIDLVAGKCVVASSGKQLGCNNDSACGATTNPGTSSIVGAGLNERGILTVTVDTFSTTKCGAYELNATVQ